MKRINILVIFFLNHVALAIRNPFEWLQPMNSTKPVILNVENQNDIATNSTWQITSSDDDTLILKNNDGELRKIQMTQVSQ